MPPVDHNNEAELPTKPLFTKMVWLLGLSCFGMNQNGRATESGGGGAVIPTSNAAEPQSVHSSFRFSFCSQVELDSMNIPSASSATVLMVNLDNGLGKELGWRRIQSLERSISPVANSLVWFHYSEILAATRTFSQGRVLGRGALSYVFRGRVGLLRSCVAIKRLDKEDKESSEAFCRELMIAISLHHPNVVPLLGFCIDPEEGLFLVYNYASGGSLERHLHEGRKKKKRGVKGNSTLPWSVRYKVAIGVAKAIAYLHSGTKR
ncbi:Receptor-like kinase LIP2 [Linum perenne]